MARKRADDDLSRYGRLAEYNRKRRFDVTPEPPGRAGKPRGRAREFVVQKHRASHLHYDFRIEHDGVMLSWAVAKGPSLDPTVRRLAMMTEPHPMDYNDFEGVIPEGEYGGGTVMIWDRGTWEPESPDVDRALAKGDLKMRLHGRKLKGSWVLVRMRDRQWLLIKHRDQYASSTVDLTVARPRSVVSPARSGPSPSPIQITGRSATHEPSPRNHDSGTVFATSYASPREKRWTRRTCRSRCASAR